MCVFKVIPSPLRWARRNLPSWADEPVYICMWMKPKESDCEWRLPGMIYPPQKTASFAEVKKMTEKGNDLCTKVGTADWGCS